LARGRVAVAFDAGPLAMVQATILDDVINVCDRGVGQGGGGGARGVGRKEQEEVNECEEREKPDTGRLTKSSMAR